MLVWLAINTYEMGYTTVHGDRVLKTLKGVLDMMQFGHAEYHELNDVSMRLIRPHE